MDLLTLSIFELQEYLEFVFNKRMPDNLMLPHNYSELYKDINRASEEYQILYANWKLLVDTINAEIDSRLKKLFGI